MSLVDPSQEIGDVFWATGRIRESGDSGSLSLAIWTWTSFHHWSLGYCPYRDIELETIIDSISNKNWSVTFLIEMIWVSSIDCQHEIRLSRSLLRLTTNVASTRFIQSTFPPPPHIIHSINVIAINVNVSIFAECKTCSEDLIAKTTRTAGAHGFDSVVLNNNGACSTLTFNCKGLNANIEASKSGLFFCYIARWQHWSSSDIGKTNKS